MLLILCYTVVKCLHCSQITGICASRYIKKCNRNAGMHVVMPCDIRSILQMQSCLGWVSRSGYMFPVISIVWLPSMRERERERVSNILATMHPVNTLCLWVCCIECVCDCIMVIHEPHAHTPTRTRQWPRALKPKSYSLVKGNRTILNWSKTPLSLLFKFTEEM